MRARLAVVLEQLWHRVPGGTATSARGAVRALHGRGDLDLVGVSARHRHPPAPDFAVPVPTVAVPLPRRALYESWHRLRAPDLSSALGPVDAVWSTGYAVPPTAAPLLVTLHDLAWRRDPGQFTRRGVRFFEQSLRLAREEADLVHAPSEATAADLRAAGIDDARLRVIPWGVVGDPRDRATKEREVARVRRAWSLPDDYLVFVGTREPRKNLAALVRAWSSLGPSAPELVLVGPRGWDGRESSGSIESVDRLRVLGFVPEADLRAVVRGARALCYPSRWEGFGLPVLEACAEGTPVLTTEGTSMEELLTDEGGSLTPAAVLSSPDPDGLADALRALLAATAAPEERERLGQAARAVADRHSWDRFAGGFGSVVQELVS